jgi:hypothetical protein
MCPKALPAAIHGHNHGVLVGDRAAGVSVVENVTAEIADQVVLPEDLPALLVEAVQHGVCADRKEAVSRHQRRGVRTGTVLGHGFRIG